MRYRQIVFLVAALLVALGVYALLVMPRQEFPAFTIRQGLVIGVYPGASSGEVEQQLTTEVEKYLFGYKEINKKKTYSYSKEGMMIVFVELNDNVKNSDEFWAKLNHGLNNFKMQLPSGVLALFSDNDFGDTSALLITLESDHKTYRELEGYLNELESRLRRIESVSKLRHYGLQKEQISIYLEKDKLTNYGISAKTLLAGLFTQGFTTASGSVDNSRMVAPIHISQSFTNEQEIAEQIIYSDPAGNLIRLKDVARVVREYPDPDSYITNNGHHCLLISMEMQNGNNIVTYGKEVDRVLNQFQKELPDGVSIERIADQPKVVSDSISTFLLEMLIAICAVILVTMVLLPLRVASVAATSIPVTIFASLGIMLLGGMELNTVTLAALIVVLGMIVDNSIVIVDSYMERLDHGYSRWHATIGSAKGFFKAIFSATLAISITFFPFLFTLKGMFQEFVQLFPWTVSISLGISLLVAMLLIPFIQYVFIKEGFEKSKRVRKKGRRNFLDLIQERYEKWLVGAFRHPRTTIGLGVASVVVGIVLFTQVPQRLMPVAERNQFAVEIYLPQGSSLEQTAQVADSLEKILKQDQRVISVSSFAGISSPRFHTTYAPNLPGKNYAQFIVNTPSNKITEELLDECTRKYEGYFPNAHIRFKQLDYQVAAFPIEVRLSGNEMTDLKSAADSLTEKLKQVPGLTWVHHNWGEMLPGARVDIRATEANKLGITKTTVATNLAMRFDGLPLTTLWENDYPVAVKLKAERAGEATCADVENEYIHSFVPGISVPLRQLADVHPDWTQGQIVRRNGVRTLSIVGDVDRGVNINKVFREVKAVAGSQRMPDGIGLSYGGARETDEEQLPQILSGLVVSIFIIFLILVFHFRKVKLALLVLGSASLSLVGTVLGMLVMHVEFSLTSILGVVSLVGIIVRNGIIMLDYAEELRRHGKKSALEAAFEAGKRRMRPIFLTSAAASMGVIPMILSKSALWSPMGTVIFFGTLTSMVLLVLTLPVAYWLIFRKSGDAGRAKTVASLPGSSPLKPALLTLLLLGCLSPALQAQHRYSLQESRKLALQNNAEVKNKMLEVEVSRQEKKAAFTKYFPQADATGFAFRFDKPMFDMKIPGGNLPVYDGNPANLFKATQFAYFPGTTLSLFEKGKVGLVTATQPVFAGRRIATGNKLADLGVEVSQIRLTATKEEIAIETERQFWQVVALTEKLKTLDRYRQMVDTLHKEVKDACQAGLINRNELLKVELKQNELQMNRLQLTNGIELAKMALCQYIGVNYDPAISFADSLATADTRQPVFADHRQALADRAEYRLLQKSTEAEKYRTRMERGEYLPQLGVGAGGQYLDVMADKHTTLGMVYGTVKIPLSGWWEASHKLKERRLKEEQNRNMVADNTEKLLLQMQQAQNSLTEAYRQILLAGVAVGQAEENLKVNRDQYAAGLERVSDLLEAQALLQGAYDNLTNLRCSYQLAKSKYLQVTGKYE